jgi:hypothetical protein
MHLIQALSTMFYLFIKGAVIPGAARVWHSRNMRSKVVHPVLTIRGLAINTASLYTGVHTVLYSEELANAIANFANSELHFCCITSLLFSIRMLFMRLGVFERQQWRHATVFKLGDHRGTGGGQISRRGSSQRQLYVSST